MIPETSGLGFGREEEDSLEDRRISFPDTDRSATVRAKKEEAGKPSGSIERLE
jgi:hypothetical protein